MNENLTSDELYPIIHLFGDDIEVAITHTNQYGEEYYSFVNGQHTTQGGTHLTAFREAVARVIKEFYNRNFEYSDIRNGIVAAISIKVEEPVFESQTKTKLGSKEMGPNGISVSKHINDFLKQELDNYLHKNPDMVDVLQKKILDSEKERKAIAGVTKLAKERAKKANLHNKKNYAIAESITTMLKVMTGKNQVSSLLREILQVAPSPRVAIPISRLCSAFAGSLLTVSG